ncbi:glutathione S-transferase T2-like [Eutrema salsugineum]|uniref:glutathione S-transferase T2-like n=1 Tax=Eutrema salsugineum TaxID=72664 RepID=UPI000CECF231|nr:glutathione S-transferase T2-like [Eutrema salsugineum]
MDYSSSHPFTQSSNFVDLLNSQQEVPLHDPFSSQSQIPLFSSQCTEGSSYNEESPAQRKERNMWTPTDDVLLISAWLNTSKDLVVANEQKCGAFWKRIAAYFAATPKAAGRERREATTCKARWQKINDLVCKFCGAYEAARRERASGMNENDELRNNQKWCEVSAQRAEGVAKRRRCNEGPNSPTSVGQEKNNGDDNQGSNRPPGVKAAKGKGKKKVEDDKALSEFSNMWLLMEKDMAMKERIQKMGLLDSLIAKKELLSDLSVKFKFV